jgi:transcriptional regulator with XRE-family HTH domain
MVGSSIKHLRKRYNVTQKDLAQWLGVSRQAISMWEANKREIKASTLNKIANVFGVTLDEVIRSQSGSTDKEGKMFGSLRRLNAEFSLLAPNAKRVALTGDFQKWSKNGIPMKRDKTGNWKALVALKPGRYEYKFIVDDVWQCDPANTKTATNSFGTLNSVKELVFK